MCTLTCDQPMVYYQHFNISYFFKKYLYQSRWRNYFVPQTVNVWTLGSIVITDIHDVSYISYFTGIKIERGCLLIRPSDWNKINWSIFLSSVIELRICPACTSGIYLASVIVRGSDDVYLHLIMYIYNEMWSAYGILATVFTSAVTTIMLDCLYLQLVKQPNRS